MENYNSELVDFAFNKITIRSLPASSRIMIALTCYTTTNTYIFDPQTRALNLTHPPAKRVECKPIELYTTTDPVLMRGTIATQLGTWEVLPEQLREELIDKLYKRTKEMVNENLTTFATCNIGVVDRVFYQYVVNSSVGKMVPASDSSMKALKRIILVDGSGCDKTCSVCLEEFPDGCQVLCLPCSHEFHQDCITKWLSSSHYCKNCRYEMPGENK